jgi:hypothetical protein
MRHGVRVSAVVKSQIGISWLEAQTMPQDEHRIVLLAEQIWPTLEAFLNRMFERSFHALEMTATKTAATSGMIRNGVKEELKLIAGSLAKMTNNSIGLSAVVEASLKSDQQLDVAKDIYLMGHQLAIQRLFMNGRCPIVRMENDWIPILEFEFGSEKLGDSAEVKFVQKHEEKRRRYAEQFEVSDAPASQIPVLMERPLAHFLGARLFGSSIAKGSAAPNVEVQNTQHGWQVIYSPAYLSQQIGLGGPSTPVKGYVPPGTYRFGIAKPAQVKWNATHWNVPTATPIFIPIP